MGYEIAKRFTFDASHQLSGLPEGHKCGRLHGHTYAVELVLAADELDGVGFVRDYGDLAAFKEFIDANLDHRHLNDWIAAHPLVGAGDPAFANPTAERLAWLLYREAQRLGISEVVEVRVAETAATWASWRPATSERRTLAARLDRLERQFAGMPTK